MSPTQRTGVTGAAKELRKAATHIQRLRACNLAHNGPTDTYACGMRLGYQIAIDELRKRAARLETGR